MIVAGFGFRSSATVDSLTSALSEAGVNAVDAIATAEDKSKTTVFINFAETIGAQIVSIDASALTQSETHTQSQASQTHRDTGSVAEAAALAALGEDAKLLAPRSISNDRMATCAIAQGPKS
ncbi:MAG: cobalamin biosynthesis protein [Ascidiaceihabitans sp.]|nr:cobalamin biosynthesis protein [Ascidiaceihabitans sp.]